MFHPSNFAFILVEFHYLCIRLTLEFEVFVLRVREIYINYICFYMVYNLIQDLNLGSHCVLYTKLNDSDTLH